MTVNADLFTLYLRAIRKILGFAAERHSKISKRLYERYLNELNRYQENLTFGYASNGQMRLDAEGLSFSESLSVPNRTEDLAIYRTYFGTTRAAELSGTDFSNIQADSYFLSNNQSVLKVASSNGYIPVYVPLSVTDNPLISALQAKIFKCLPFLSSRLCRYQKLIYIDAKISYDFRNLLDFVASCEEYSSKNKSLYLFPHPWSKSFEEEFFESMFQDRYRILAPKLRTYFASHAHFVNKISTLVQTGLIVYNLNHDEMRHICRDWFEGILTAGIQCQLVLDILLVQYDSWSLLPESLRNTDLVARTKSMF